MKKTLVILMILFLMSLVTSCSDKEEQKNIAQETSKSHTDEKNTENRAKDVDHRINIGEEDFDLDSMINTEELEGLNNKELSLLRNAIYAKHGYRFKSLKYSEYFGEIEWYQPKSDDVNDMLTDIDIQNIERIVEIEKSKEMDNLENIVSEIASDSEKNNYEDKDVITVTDNTPQTYDVVEIGSPPQQYIDFMKEKDPNRNIAFYAREDIDFDGNDEVIIATGIIKESPVDSYIYHLYILRENDGRIEQLGENLAVGGYSVYNLKLIQLQGMPQKYVYCGIGNGAGLLGFKIYGLSNNEPNIIGYSASATGSGIDELKDFDSDGKYDGYVQNRWSYDVLYYSTSNTYVLDNNDFKLDHSLVEIPKYPESIKDTLIQYLSLRVLNIFTEGKSPEVNKRLSELCIYSKANDIEISSEVWYYPLYNEIMFMSNTVKFEIEENDNNATATVSYVGDNEKEYKCEFHLIKLGDNWHIDKIINL